MASTQQIKGRIRSVKTTKQITKAMEMVAASRMRRAQEATTRTRLYAETARELLTRLSQLTDVKNDPLFAGRSIKNRLIILITSDRGLAGAYDSNMLKLYTQQLKADRAAKIGTQTICIGRKGSNFVARVKDVQTVGVYHDFPDQPSANELRPILDTVVQLFITGEIDAVDVIFTGYINSLRQESRQQRILPAGFEETEVSHAIDTADFEPSAEVVLQNTTMRLLEVQLFQSMLDAKASEYSMRMIAMRNATDNATGLIDDLTLEFNNARQAAITQELAEITGGAEAMK
ncbi:MAG TPA: ATP synthase F1 subunit gamma [Candidatus Saccharimonadales bacterium]|nr:ATP synthase F1 subunit gamma [Candidatus Saccharimonadales bacterium]